MDADAWYGGDINKIWLKAGAEGELAADLKKLMSRLCGAGRSILGSIFRQGSAMRPFADKERVTCLS